MRDLANERKRFGYRRLFVLLRQEGEPSGINRIYRLYREEGLTVRKRRARRRAVGSRAPIPVESKPNARWSVDFVHDQLVCGRRLRILNIVDDVTRDFDRFDVALREAGYVAMGGQIVDASLIAAPKQRNTEEEKKAVKEGRIPEAWKAKPAKLRHKDRDARWTVKFSKAKARPDGTVPPVDIAIPTFGYQNHVSIDREHGLIRRWDATDAAAYEGARLREGLFDKTNTASAVWADTAYRSKANEAFLESNGFVSRIHRKKPPRRPMPETTRRANAVKSKVRSGVEHVFAVQKDKMDLFIRTVGIARARLKIGMANLVYNFRRLVYLDRIAAA